jgi:hypothetical protein
MIGGAMRLGPSARIAEQVYYGVCLYKVLTRKIKPHLTIIEKSKTDEPIELGASVAMAELKGRMILFVWQKDWSKNQMTPC